MQWDMLSLTGDRPVNEDAARIVDTKGLKCFVIADGLGGEGQGEVASKIAADSFERVFKKNDGELRPLFYLAFSAAQSDIIQEQERQRRPFQMKTTVCALAVKDDIVMWGHIGDTRLYAFHKGKIKIRTLDHSVPQMLVLTKEIKEKAIRDHPDRNKLLRVLGIAGDTPRFELSKGYRLNMYDAFLLCSDGFWELIVEKEMCASLKRSVSPSEWLNEMRKIVEKKGKGRAMDNYTAIAIMI